METIDINSQNSRRNFLKKATATAVSLAGVNLLSASTDSFVSKPSILICVFNRKFVKIFTDLKPAQNLKLQESVMLY